MSEQMIGIVLGSWVVLAVVAGVALIVGGVKDARQLRRQQEQGRQPKDYSVWHTWPGTYQEPESKFEYPMSGRD